MLDSKRGECFEKPEMYKCFKCEKMMMENKPMMAKCECKYDMKMPIEPCKMNKCNHMCE